MRGANKQNKRQKKTTINKQKCLQKINNSFTVKLDNVILVTKYESFLKWKLTIPGGIILRNRFFKIRVKIT